jgi:hypothetical protein
MDQVVRIAYMKATHGRMSDMKVFGVYSSKGLKERKYLVLSFGSLSLPGRSPTNDGKTAKQNQPPRDEQGNPPGLEFFP